MQADPAVVFAKAAQRRCREICREIVDVIQSAPETPRRTGHLLRSYKVVSEPPGALIINDAVNENGDAYWRYVEFGTRKMHAEPHVRPAIELVRKRHTR